MSPSDTTPFKEYVLHKLEEQLQIRLSHYEFQQLRFEAHDGYFEEVVFHIIRQFYGNKIEREVCIGFDIPKNWWQHFKQDKFPAWLLKRFPVKTTRITKSKELTTTFEYPDLIKDWKPRKEVYIVRQFLNPPIV